MQGLLNNSKTQWPFGHSFLTESMAIGMGNRASQEI